jgi:hypothetical protein
MRNIQSISTDDLATVTGGCGGGRCKNCQNNNNNTTIVNNNYGRRRPPADDVNVSVATGVGAQPASPA